MRQPLGSAADAVVQAWVRCVVTGASIERLFYPSAWRLHFSQTCPQGEAVRRRGTAGTHILAMGSLAGRLCLGGVGTGGWLRLTLVQASTPFGFVVDAPQLCQC